MRDGVCVSVSEGVAEMEGVCEGVCVDDDVSVTLALCDTLGVLVCVIDGVIEVVDDADCVSLGVCVCVCDADCETLWD